MTNVWPTVLSDLCVNLAAAWLGIIVVLPLQSKKLRQPDFLILTTNLTLATLALIAAFELRRGIGL